MVVGRVIWDSDASDETPTVESSGSMNDQDWPATILAKLRYLVAATAPDSFERLLTLRSRFWSFVDVSPKRSGRYIDETGHPIASRSPLP